MQSSRDVIPTGRRPLQNPFSCNVCNKSYTRIDHLARHYRSHSRERPFACETCGKTFARVDLLKRHAANHNNADEGSAGATSVAKRRKIQPVVHRPRAQRACQACADAKSRCEGDIPCLRCQQKSIPCEYPPPCSNNAQGHNRTRQTGAPQFGDDHQLASGRPSFGEPQVTVLRSAAASMADQTRNSTVNAPESVGVQPSIFGPENIMSASNYGVYLMDSLEGLPAFDFLRDAQSVANPVGSRLDLINDEAFPKDVLDFGVDFAFSTPSVFDAEFQIPFGQQSLQFAPNFRDTDLEVTKSGVVTPGIRSKFNINASAQAFKESLWLWTPEKDDHGALEQRNLSLPWDNVSADDHLAESLPAHQRVTNRARGDILAMVLRTCEPAIYSHVVSNFPSAELLTKLIHNFIIFHLRSDMPWIHQATIDVNKENPEFLGSMIAFGAAISTEPEIRKLGFAIQEAVRIINFSECERDNRLTRKLRPLQSFALQLEIGLWSGDRRKMEISESFTMPLITMVRRAGHFRGAKAAEFSPQQEDTGSSLEAKWRSWVQQESFKRLALYLFYRDARSSMSLLSPPLVSYAELTTALPCRREVWEAKTAIEWKAMYLTPHQDKDQTSQSRRSFLDDSAYVFGHQQTVDVDISVLLLISAVWTRVWQYREMVTAAKFSSNQEARHDSLIINSRRHELGQILEHVRMNAHEWDVELKPAAWLLHEQCLMHLCVSLEDVQLLAGKEGEEEARRILPALSSWAESSEARQAVFHAGQIFRAAKEHQKLMLRDASAVAVYHASLVFWAYAVLKNDQTLSLDALSAEDNKSALLVRVDGPECPKIRRFLLLGRGIPCIETLPQDSDTCAGQEVPLSEPAEVMRTITRVLQRQHECGGRSGPPLIENLSKLMHSLGRAVIRKMSG